MTTYTVMAHHHTNYEFRGRRAYRYLALTVYTFPILGGGWWASLVPGNFKSRDYVDELDAVYGVLYRNGYRPVSVTAIPGD
jgi:hypothetical protein